MRLLAAPLRLALALVVTVLVSSSSIWEANAALNPNRIELAQLTAAPAVHGGEVFVPLADVARLTQCQVSLDTRSQGYEAWPCKPSGRIAVDPTVIASYGGPDAKPNGKLADTTWFNPQPDPPRELSVREATLSRRVLTDASGQAWVPLADLATAMGGKVRSRRGKTFISVPRRASTRPLLRLRRDR